MKQNMNDVIIIVSYTEIMSILGNKLTIMSSISIPDRSIIHKSAVTVCLKTIKSIKTRTKYLFRYKLSL